MSGLSTLPTLRCDKGVAQKNTAGCVFPQAAAVYVLKTSDFEVREAAEHVAEAQANGSPGAFAMREGTKAFADSGSLGRELQRLKNAVDIKNPNRNAACNRESATSLINVRPPQSSATCSPAQAGCQCDEYPFNATYQGAFYAPETTSVKWINGSQNGKAGGSKLSGFLSSSDLAPCPRGTVGQLIEDPCMQEAILIAPGLNEWMEFAANALESGRFVADPSSGEWVDTLYGPHNRRSYSYYGWNSSGAIDDGPSA